MFPVAAGCLLPDEKERKLYRCDVLSHAEGACEVLVHSTSLPESSVVREGCVAAGGEGVEWCDMSAQKKRREGKAQGQEIWDNVRASFRFMFRRQGTANI